MMQQNCDEKHLAAIAIQACWRGFLIRSKIVHKVQRMYRAAIEELEQVCGYSDVFRFPRSKTLCLPIHKRELWCAQHGESSTPKQNQPYLEQPSEQLETMEAELSWLKNLRTKRAEYLLKSCGQVA